MRRKTKTDFSANPHNVQIGDWVVQEGQGAKDKGQGNVIGEVIGEQNVIGEVVAQVDTSGNMLQFWVSWFESISNHPTPELASNLVKIPKSEDGYVGQSIAQGLISSMIWTGDEVKYQVYKNKQTIVKTREQIESALNSKTVNINNIIIDQNLQQRVKLDNSVIDDYAIAYSEGIEFPPITIWKCTDEQGNSENDSVACSPFPVPSYYLVDGFHRVSAAKKAGIEELPFIEKSGIYREALLFSLSVNATHGLRRSNADKRKAVMTLLQDSEWSQWSDRHIARQCGVSNRFVSNLRKQFIHTNENTTLVDNCNLTVNVHSGNQKSNEGVTRTYITKDGVEAKMRVGNIGQGKSSESLPPEEDNEIIPEQFEDIEFTDFEENNLIYDAPVEIDDFQTDTELKDSTNTKPSKKITNPLSVGDKVKVKDNHYFSGKEGVVTQISSPHSVTLVFDDDQRELIRLLDLDLPSLSKTQKPQKKEILIKEGLNYKVGEGCKWYVEVEEQIYKGLQIYQEKVSTPTMNGAFSRFLVEKGILKPYPDNPTKLLELKDTTPTLKALNISVTTLNMLQQYINRHGEEALRAKL